MPSSDFLHDATARGFVHQCTDPEGLHAALGAGRVTAYIGFDCTADSLHVGSLVQIMLLRLMQRHGHRPVVLMGGGTTRIGDPSGKDESRQLLTDAQIAANMAGIRRCFTPFLTFGDGPADAIMPNNDDWLDALGYISAAARSRRAFHRQPHADLRLGAAAAGPRAAADVPRIQLHDPAELRFPRAVPPARGDAADGRVGPVGQHRLRRRSGAPHRGRDGVRPDHAADHHRLGRQDGQDRARARCG